MLSKIGVALFCFGIVTADSEWLIIPLSLIIAGAALYKAGERREER